MKLLSLTVSIVALIALGCFAKRQYVLRGITCETLRPATAAAKEDPLKFLAIFEHNLPLLCKLNDKFVAAQAQSISAKMPEIRKLFETAFTGCEGMKIDFILQMHLSDRGDADMKIQMKGEKKFTDVEAYRQHVIASTKASQESILRLLSLNSYSMLSLEGLALDGSDDSTVAREFYSRVGLQRSDSDICRLCIDKDGRIVPFDKVRATLELGIQNLKQKNDPEVALILRDAKGYHGDYFGGEDLNLHLFHIHYQQLMDQNSDVRFVVKEGEDLKDLGCWLAMKIRSQYVVAKTIRDMREHNLKSAVIVFGMGHVLDFRELASTLRLDSRIWNTTTVSTTDTRMIMDSMEKPILDVR